MGRCWKRRRRQGSGPESSPYQGGASRGAGAHCVGLWARYSHRTSMGWGMPVCKSVTLAIVALMCSTAPTVTHRIAFAQAGSTGGTIGKTDKSVSGGEEALPGHQHAKPKTWERDRPATPRAGSITGNWIWHGKCADDSEWAGTFDLEQHNDGTVTGTCSAVRETCSSVAGHVTANKAMLNVGWAYSTGTLEFTISEGRQRMSGWEMGRYHGRCTYEARRS